MRGVSQIGIAAGLAVAGFAMSANAALIASFENTPGSGGYSSWSYSTSIGVTNGTYSAYKTFGTGWAQTALVAYGGVETTLANNPLLKLDITIPANSGSPVDAWYGLQFAIQGENWNSQAMKAGPYVALNSGQLLNGVAQTISWDLTSQNLPTGASWFNVLLITQGNYSQAIYIDNLRAEAVPEPTSLGLIGLASTALLRRRRR